MKLHLASLKDRKAWENAGFALPEFDLDAVREQTHRQPTWLHLGAGNIFRAFPAAVLQQMLNKGEYDTGLVVAECFDGDIIERAYTPYDSLSILSVLKADGSVQNKVIASVVEALRCDGECPQDDARLQEILTKKSLQMVSLTITEKGYAIMDPAGNSLSFIERDIDAPPAFAKTTIGKCKVVRLISKIPSGIISCVALAWRCLHRGKSSFGNIGEFLFDLVKRPVKTV